MWVRVSGRSGISVTPAKPQYINAIWGFSKMRVPYFGVLIIRILLFRVLY